MIFTSRRRTGDPDADASYQETSAAMVALASEQPGFLSVTSVRDPATGHGITVSYWVDDSAARSWKAVAEHLEAQQRGRAEWYSEYEVVVATVTRHYGRA